VVANQSASVVAALVAEVAVLVERQAGHFAAEMIVNSLGLKDCLSLSM
jgi:hypothetical protein